MTYSQKVKVKLPKPYSKYARYVKVNLPNGKSRWYTIQTINAIVEGWYTTQSINLVASLCHVRAEVVRAVFVDVFGEEELAKRSNALHTMAGHKAKKREVPQWKIDTVLSYWDSDLSMRQISRVCHVTEKRVSKIYHSNFSQQEFDDRMWRMYTRHREGERKNSTANGCVIIHKSNLPWYEGNYVCNNAYVYESVANYCKAHGLTNVEPGMLVVHIDGDKTNNDPTNLTLMTRSEMQIYYMKLKGVRKNGGATHSLPKVQPG